MTQATQRARKRGLFGGSFDPVHCAHVALAAAALQALQLDEVRWIPTGQAWQKARALTPAPQRLAMLELAVAHEPRFVLDPIEIDRTGPSYTLDTVRSLQADHPEDEWFLLIGQDQFARLHTWHDWQELLQRVVLAVANRPGEIRQVNAVVQAQQHRIVPLPMLDISATEVRRRVTQGADISPLVPPAVARYIENHGLYKTAQR